MQIAPGQISIWDIEIINKNLQKKDEKTVKPLELTDLQQRFIKEKVSMKNENLSRVIKYCGGGLGIELQEETNIRTIYVNEEGKEEFTRENRMPVLPMDKILHSKIADSPLNSLQEEKLKELKGKHPMAKVIRRKGDENVILELENKVISVNRKGWVLEFNNVQAVYGTDEVAREEIDLKDMQWSAKAGDIIETTYGKEVIAAEVYRIYNSGYTLSIVWDEKHTAIPRCAIRKILRSA